MLSISRLLALIFKVSSDVGKLWRWSRTKKSISIPYIAFNLSERCFRLLSSNLSRSLRNFCTAILVSSTITGELCSKQKVNFCTLNGMKSKFLVGYCIQTSLSLVNVHSFLICPTRSICEPAYTVSERLWSLYFGTEMFTKAPLGLRSDVLMSKFFTIPS